MEIDSLKETNKLEIGDSFQPSENTWKESYLPIVYIDKEILTGDSLQIHQELLDEYKQKHKLYNVESFSDLKVPNARCLLYKESNVLIILSSNRCDLDSVAKELANEFSCKVFAMNDNASCTRLAKKKYNP